MWNKPAPKLSLLALVLATASGCLGGSPEADQEPECRCTFTGGGYAYDVPCGTVLCAGEVPALCDTDGTGEQLEGRCDAEEADSFTSGYCRHTGSHSCIGATDAECSADPRCEFWCSTVGPFYPCDCQYADGYSYYDDEDVDCPTIRDDVLCDSTIGCGWVPADCNGLPDGCQGFKEPVGT